jgi:hypothetical protein
MVSLGPKLLGIVIKPSANALLHGRIAAVDAAKIGKSVVADAKDFAAGASRRLLFAADGTILNACPR